MRQIQEHLHIILQNILLTTEEFNPDIEEIHCLIERSLIGLNNF